MLGKMVLTFESVCEILRPTIQMKATEQYFPVMLFITAVYKAVVGFASVYEILRCDHSNKT